MSISLAKTSELVGSGRLDPEYYQPHYQALHAKLKSIGAVTIDSFADANDGFHESPVWVEGGGIPCISAKCVKDNYFVLTDAGQVSLSQRDKNPTKEARVGDVLITSVGTIGNSAVVHKEILPAIMDRHVGIVRIHKNANVDPYYLAAFLNSKYGRFQTWRESTGNVQLSLFIEKINKLLVPVGEQFNATGKLVRKSYDKFRQSKQLYADAENLLASELGLDKLDLSESLFNIRTVSDVLKSKRMDADHYRQKYYRVLKAIEELKPKSISPLGELTDTLTNGHTPLYHDLDTGDMPFFTAEHVYDFRLDHENARSIWKEHHETLLKRTQLRNNDVLITIKGRVGNAAVVYDLPSETNINQDVALLRLKSGIHPWYIAGFLNSPAGKALMEQIATGQINPFLGLGNLTQIKIPIFDEKRMNELGEKIRKTVEKAESARQEAKRLLAEAKSEVEKMIEGI